MFHQNHYRDCSYVKVLCPLQAVIGNEDYLTATKFKVPDNQ